jgi:phosphomethylpyrimidine synthase
MFKDLLSNSWFRQTLSSAAKREGISRDKIETGIKSGTIVVTRNKNRRHARPCAIGQGLATKINVNIGTSPDRPNLAVELKKLELAVRLEADAVMDLSLGGDLRKNRLAVLKDSPLPVGTVPIYEAAMKAQRRRGSFLNLEAEEILDVIQDHAATGVDFLTLHCGINQRSLNVFLKHRRLMDVVSRGGALLVHWMKTNRRENPLYERFDDILAIAREHNVTLSLGDGMRPGSIIDATDAAQIAELKELGLLTERARKAGVQVIIEGPGHVPLDQIEENMKLEKRICHGAPFYVLGPLVTDIGLGYDHISGAIGGALAAIHGADFLCYLTPAEHVSHPSLEDARQGIIASKIAAHAADIVKKIPGAKDRDLKLSKARKDRNWDRQIALSLDPERAREYRDRAHPKVKDACTMCGEFCSIRLIDQCLPRSHKKKT